MRQEIFVNFEHPANGGVIRYLKLSQKSLDLPEHQPSVSPDHIDDPYMRLGTHPELVSRLWDEAAVGLPEACTWVVYGWPVLVNPKSSIIFAFDGGTDTYAMRLPPEQYQEARALGAKRVLRYPALPEINQEALTVDLRRMGDGWLFLDCLTRNKEEIWCLSAYQLSSWHLG